MIGVYLNQNQWWANVDTDTDTDIELKLLPTWTRKDTDMDNLKKLRAMKALKTKFLKIAFKWLVSYSNFENKHYSVKLTF